jgi:phage gp29-like protein
MPIRGAKVPSKAAEEDKERFVTAIAQMSTENAVLLPQGSEEGQSFNIELIEASSQSWEGFKELIAQTDIAIAVAVLGQNLTTEAGTGTKGALATAMVHQDVRQDVIESDSETLSDCLHEHTVEPWSEANYGSAEAAPKATFATDPPDDLDAKSKVLGQVATALQSYRGLQIPLDVKQVLTDYEIPFDEDAEMPDFTEPLEPDPNEAANGAQPTNGAQGKEAPDKEPAKGSEAA